MLWGMPQWNAHTGLGSLRYTPLLPEIMCCIEKNSLRNFEILIDASKHFLFETEIYTFDEGRNNSFENSTTRSFEKLC